MENGIGLSTRMYADRFVGERYIELVDLFKDSDNIQVLGVSSLDKLNDTILSLYEIKKEFGTYEDFKKFANNKFTEKEKRK